MRTKDFETNQNIEDDKQKELIKAIVNPWDGQLVNDKKTVSDYTREKNNIGITNNLLQRLKIIFDDIIERTNQNISDETISSEKPSIKIEEEIKIETKPTLNEILTDQVPAANETWDLYIDDDNLLVNTYNNVLDIVEPIDVNAIKLSNTNIDQEPLDLKLNLKKEVKN